MSRLGMMYVECKWFVGDDAIWIEDGIVAFLEDLNPKGPVGSFYLLLVLFDWRVLVDEIFDIFFKNGGYPSRRCGVKLKAFFFLVADGSYFYFFAGDGAIDLVEGEVCKGL